MRANGSAWLLIAVDSVGERGKAGETDQCSPMEIPHFRFLSSYHRRLDMGQ